MFLSNRTRHGLKHAIFNYKRWPEWNSTSKITTTFNKCQIEHATLVFWDLCFFDPYDAAC